MGPEEKYTPALAGKSPSQGTKQVQMLHVTTRELQ